MIIKTLISCQKTNSTQKFKLLNKISRYNLLYIDWNTILYSEELQDVNHNGTGQQDVEDGSQAASIVTSVLNEYDLI